MGVPTSDWIYWCRLCARDDVVYKVRERDDDLVRIISKCFDVEVCYSFSQPTDSSYIIATHADDPRGTGTGQHVVRGVLLGDWPADHLLG